MKVGNVVAIEGEVKENFDHANRIVQTFPDGMEGEKIMEILTMAFVLAIATLARDSDHAREMAKTTAQCLMANVEYNAVHGRVQ